MPNNLSAKSQPLFSPMQKIILGICIGALIIYGLYLSQILMLPFLISLILAYLLSPLVDRLEFVFKKRVIAVFVLYFFFFGIVGLGLMVWLPKIINEVTALTINAPAYSQKIETLKTELKTEVEQKYPLIKNMQGFDKLEILTKKFAKEFSFTTMMISIVSIISSISLVPFILFIFLIEGNEIKKTALGLIPNRYFEMILNLTHKISSQLGGYLRAMLIESIILSVLASLFLLALGVDYALIIGGLTGFANLIPYVGPFTAAIPALIVFYLKMKTFNAILIIVAGFCALQFIDNMIIQPIIYSQSIDIHPLIVLCAVILGGTYGGLWGMFLAVPMVGILKVICKELLKEFRFRRQMALEADETMS